MKVADVEDLYQYVSVGTPVTVYYDRLVIDVDPDHTVSYYIYPDGYGWQSLSIAQVKKALAGYGVEDFADFQEISDKINASDGNVAAAGRLLTKAKRPATGPSGKTAGKNGQIYRPSAVGDGAESGFTVEFPAGHPDQSLWHRPGIRQERRRLHERRRRLLPVPSQR